MQQMNEQTMKTNPFIKNELKTTNIDFVVTCNLLLLSSSNILSRLHISCICLSQESHLFCQCSCTLCCNVYLQKKRMILTSVVYVIYGLQGWCAAVVYKGEGGQVGVGFGRSWDDVDGGLTTAIAVWRRKGCPGGVVCKHERGWTAEEEQRLKCFHNAVTIMRADHSLQVGSL